MYCHMYMQEYLVSQQQHRQQVLQQMWSIKQTHQIPGTQTNISNHVGNSQYFNLPVALLLRSINPLNI